MGGGSSKVRPLAKVSDSDISFKSLEEKPSHKKKPGLVRVIIDAILGEDSQPSDELGFARFSESPESGTDFEIEEAFVDAPLPNVHSGKDIKSEKKLTPGRARTKWKGVTSQYSTNQSAHVVDELCSTPCPKEEGQTSTSSVQDEPDVTRVGQYTPEFQTFNKAGKCVPSPHGRGDSAAPEDNNTKVDKDCPNEDLVVPKIPSNPCNYQKNCNETGGGLSDDQETQLDKRVYQVLAKISDKLNSKKGGGEATFNTENDCDQFNNQEKKEFTGADDSLSNTKSKGHFITETVMPPTERQKPVPTLKPARGIPKWHQSNKRMSELDRKSVDMFAGVQRTTEDTEAPDSTSSHHGHDGQSNNKIKFPSSGVSRTTALSTIKKMIEGTASSSNKVVTKDSGTCNRQYKNTQGSSASDIIAHGKSGSTTPDPGTVSGSADGKKSYLKFKRAQAIRRRRYLEKKSVERSALKKSYDSTSIGEASYMKTAWSKRLNGSEIGKDLQKQAQQYVVPSPPAYRPTVHQDLVYQNRVMQRKETDEIKIGNLHVDMQEKAGQRVTSSKSAIPRFSCKSLCESDSEVVSDEIKEIQEIKQDIEVPTVQMVFKKQIPSVAELDVKVEEAKKELDSIRKYLRSKQGKRIKAKNVVSNQVKLQVNSKPSTHALLNASAGLVRVPGGDKDEVQNHLLRSVSLKVAVSKSVAVNGQKEGTSTANKIPARIIKLNDVLNTSPKVGEKNPVAIGKRRGQGLEKSRKALGRRLAARLGKTPSGEGSPQDPLRSKLSKQHGPKMPPCCADAPGIEVDQVNESLRTGNCAVALSSDSDVGKQKVIQDTSREVNPYLLRLINQLRELTGRGFNGKPIKTTSNNGPFSKPGMVLVNIKKQKLTQPTKHPKHPLVPNLLSEAVTDMVIDGLSVMWMGPMTWSFLNDFMILVADLLPQLKRSSKEYFKVANTPNFRGLNVTRLLDRDLKTIFQRIRWERQRPSMLFNPQFYPRRAFQPYFDGVRFFELDVQENGYETEEQFQTKVDENAQGNKSTSFEPQVHVLGNANTHPNLMPDQRPVIAETVRTESPKTTGKLTNHASEGFRDKGSCLPAKRLDTAIEFQAKGPKPACKETTLGSEHLKKDRNNDGVPAKIQEGSNSKGLKDRKRDIDPDESNASHGNMKDTKPIPNLVKDQRVILVGNEKIEFCKRICQTFNLNPECPKNSLEERVLDLMYEFQVEGTMTTSIEAELELLKLWNAENGINHERVTKTKHGSNLKGLKDLDIPGNHVPNGDTKATIPNKTKGQPGTVTNLVGKTIKDDDSQKDNVPLIKQDIAATNRNTVSNDKGLKTKPTGGNTKKKLGRGPRIVGNVRRIVHCQRNRRTDTPTTQLKIKFCLGCGDTKQPNGEPLIMCATCDQAFFCCTKCQRATRNEHRETCKGVKRHYCKHW